jgi:hypothetical protein
MPVSFRQHFRGHHRPVRLPQLRLGQDWEMEVRALLLTPQPPKPVHIRIRYTNGNASYGAKDKLAPGNFPSSIP